MKPKSIFFQFRIQNINSQEIKDNENRDTQNHHEIFDQKDIRFSGIFY